MDVPTLQRGHRLATAFEGDEAHGLRVHAGGARDERGLYPLSLSGAEVDAYVKKQVAGYRKLAQDFGLATAAAK